MKRNARLAAAALLAALVPAAARATTYELASEWSAVSFNDGSKDLTLFTHLPDADLFEHMEDFETRTSSDGRSLDVYVPLYRLSIPNSGEGARAQGVLKSVTLQGRVTSYKMLVRLEKKHHGHLITKAPDFSVEESSVSTTLLAYLGLNAAHPDNFLIMVEPEKVEASAEVLSDIESAAIASLDPSERTAWVGQCGGEPGSAGAMACWRAKVGALLGQHKSEAPGADFSPFEQRYMQHRLSRKGYEQFQQSLTGGSDKLALAQNWHDLIMGRDIDANTAAAAKAAPASAPAVAAPAPVPAVVAAAAPAAAVQRRPSKAKPKAKPVALVLPAAPAPRSNEAKAAAPERSNRAVLIGVLAIVATGAVFLLL